MNNLLRGLVLAGVLGGGLAACGSNSTPNNPVPQVPTPTPVPVEAQFGSCFATRYEAAPNTKATDPVPCPDLPPVSATTKPANL